MVSSWAELQVLKGKIRSHIAEKQWDECIRGCTEFLDFVKKGGVGPASEEESAYLARGVAHSQMRNRDRAIADYTAVLGLNPKNDAAYYGRACAYIYKKEFGKALKDMRSAVEHAPEQTRIYSLYHIASKVQSAVTFEHLCDILNAVSAIKAELFYAPSQYPNSVFHYTELSTLKKLAEGDKFRLYNADYMNDPEEGEIFWDVMKKISGHNFRKEFHSDESRESLSPAYVGSFVRIGSENENQEMEKHDSKDGELFLWQTYGKNAGVEAAGACLLFDISKFAKRPTQNLRGISSSDGECMYRVVYAHQIGSDEYKCLRIRFKNLADKLSRISRVPDAEKKDAFLLTGELLDEIRFLFKADHFRAERELRIVQSHYPDESGLPTADGAVETDTDSFPPRFFVEVENLPLKAVVLGPAAHRFREWKHWLKKKNSALEVRKSSIRYGKRD